MLGLTVKYLRRLNDVDIGIVCLPPILDLSIIELILSKLNSIWSEKLSDEFIIFNPPKDPPEVPLLNCILPVNLWLILNFPKAVLPSLPRFLNGYILYIW